MVEKKLKRIKYLRIIKYIFAFAWVGIIVRFAIRSRGSSRIDLLYNTESGVSLNSAQALISYFAIVFVILLLTFFLGKRVFCHHFCPWGVLNIVGTKIKNFFEWSSLNLRVTTDRCKECILGDPCVDNCPHGVIRYSWHRPEKMNSDLLNDRARPTGA
ncbi:MAG: 4Fe-4S binding protein [Candidatus Zixiibacteriota bacterium]